MHGQLAECVAAGVSEDARVVPIDGYRCVMALKRLGCDTGAAERARHDWSNCTGQTEPATGDRQPSRLPHRRPSPLHRPAPAATCGIDRARQPTHGYARLRRSDLAGRVRLATPLGRRLTATAVNDGLRRAIALMPRCDSTAA